MSTRAASEDANPKSPKRQKVSEAEVVETAAAPANKGFPLLTIPNAVPGEVFIVGAGDCGQLGLGPDVCTATKLRKLAYFEDKNIVSIAAGGLHNIVLSQDGKLYSWGCNDQMALGRAGEETEPGPVEGLDNVKIVQVACGDSISAALSEDGHVYAWGTFRNKNGIFGFRPTIDVQSRPFRIPELQKVTSIAAGADHLVAFTQDRRIYTWGCGESGQLGRRILGRMEKERSLLPKQITFKPHRSLLITPKTPTKKSKEGISYQSQFIGVGCGGHQTYLIHETGTVFAIGLNNHGQLGVGDQEEYETPTPFGVLVDNTDKEKDIDSVGFVDVAGSEHHAIALDREGRIYTFGRNDDGQLGTGGSESVPTPHLLSEPKDVVAISANGAFTLAVTKDDDFDGNNLWLWGYGEMGQLANGGEDESTPNEVELKGRHVFKAQCGGQHTLLLLRPKDQ
ncbi:regulator of chromosome condensation 1/beta-lactamase-inhibitor protein II [Obelidium mucronatum]|nr:regulator of chromosome condensation 1/beta-lactamase-inhibitor protein II [Obelidium mucronatum]